MLNLHGVLNLHGGDVTICQALESGPKAPAVRQSFRKKTLTKEERLAAQAEAERILEEELKAQKKNQSQALRNLYFTRVSPASIFFVLLCN